MLVQVFLASAERGGHGGGGPGCVDRAESGGEACRLPFPHHQTHSPSHTHSPCMKSDNVGGGKQQGLSLWVFNQKVIFHSFNWLL